MIMQSYPFIRLGIIGGGQLGRMMASKAKQMGFFVAVLDPAPNSPAGQLADIEIVGDFYDPKKLQELIHRSEVATYDLEHIDAAFLKKLAAESGFRIYPAPQLLETVQDKLRQKEIFAQHGIPVPRFASADKIDRASCSRFGFPLVQKLRFGGYDGRGVKILAAPDDLVEALPGASMLEEHVALEKELAVMVARSVSGEIKSYPVVEMQFAAGNILDVLIAPARLEPTVQARAQEIAVACVEALHGVGIFGVELFLSQQGKLLVNEIAPRPHNSGHYTIEACVTGQFEQHLRAITGLRLGSPQLLSPAVMLNLLGEPNFSGPPAIEGLQEILAIPGLSFHWYGKAETRPRRKMGHVTILNENIDAALQHAGRVKELFKIKARN